MDVKTLRPEGISRSGNLSHRRSIYVKNVIARARTRIQSRFGDTIDGLSFRTRAVFAVSGRLQEWADDDVSRAPALL